MKLRLQVKIGLGFSALGLIGCSDPLNQDIEDFIRQTHVNAAVSATMLPPAPDFIPLEFVDTARRDPFVLSEAATSTLPEANNCWQPTAGTVDHLFVQHELEALHFKGVIGDKHEYWALMQTPDKFVHRVQVGQILGRNFGRVEDINDKEIAITEYLPDGLGCWEHRQVKLALVTQ